MQSLIDAAVLMRRLRDSELANSRLAVFVSLPDMWENQVCAFHNDHYFKTFTQRPDWTPLEGESLVGRLGLQLPAGFLERGFKTIQITNWQPPTEEGELWILCEA